MNIKLNIIISAISLLIILILKIINIKKYKTNNIDSLILKNEKKKTKIILVLSIILFLLTIIFNKYVNDYSWINTILESLIILILSLPITIHNLYNNYIKDEEKYSYIKTIITTKKVTKKELKEFNKANINIIIISNKPISLNIPTIEIDKVTIKEMRTNNIIKTTNIKNITNRYNESNGFYITNDLNKTYDKIINSRGILDNYQRAYKYNIITSLSLILSILIINVIYGFPFPYYLSLFSIIKLINYITTTYIYKKIPYDTDIKERLPLNKNCYITKQEKFINIFQTIMMTIGISMPYMFLLASGATQEFANTALYLTMIFSIISLTIVNLSEEIYLKNILKIFNNKYLIIYTIIYILLAIFIYYVPIFTTKQITFINVIACLLASLLTTITYDIFKLARYTSTKGTKKYERKNNKKHRRS